VYRAGKHRARVIPGRNPLWNTRVKDENGRDVFIPAVDAASYITDEFFMALDVFYTTETLGVLPFSGGWAEQPEWIARALSALKAETRRACEEEREQKQEEEERRRKNGRR
jgi:hypothetical protein